MSMQDFVLPVIVTLLGSGVWSFLIEWIKIKSEKQSAEKKMLLGLGYDVLFHRLSFYLERGYIEPDELQSVDFVYRGYVALGGNGLIKAMYEKVMALPTQKEDRDK